MIETVFIGSAFSIAAFFIWLTGSYFEKKKSQALIQVAKNELKQSETKATYLRSEMSKLKDEMLNLRKNVDQKQFEKVSALENMQRNHQIQVFKRQIVGGFAGFMVGAVAMGFWFNAQAKIHVLEELMDMKVQARVSEMKIEMLEEQKFVLAEKNFEMEKELILLRDTRAVSLTKLEMLVDHVAPTAQDAGHSQTYGPNPIQQFNPDYVMNTNSFGEMPMSTAPVA